jgi:hypothetical protein
VDKFFLDTGSYLQGLNRGPSTHESVNLGLILIFCNSFLQLFIDSDDVGSLIEILYIFFVFTCDQWKFLIGKYEFIICCVCYILFFHYLVKYSVVFSKGIVTWRRANKMCCCYCCYCCFWVFIYYACHCKLVQPGGIKTMPFRVFQNIKGFVFPAHSFTTSHPSIFFFSFILFIWIYFNCFSSIHLLSHVFLNFSYFFFHLRANLCRVSLSLSLTGLFLIYISPYIYSLCFLMYLSSPYTSKYFLLSSSL